MNQVVGVLADTVLRVTRRCRVDLIDADVHRRGVGRRPVQERRRNGRLRLRERRGTAATRGGVDRRARNYRPVSAIIQVDVRDTLRLSFTMESAVQTLETVTVVEERRSLRMLEFDQRRRQGFGFFITNEQIEQRNLPVAADYLRFAPGVALAPSPQPSGNPELVAISKREGGSIYGDGAGACAMQVVIDGVPMPARFPLELLPTPKEIAGFEIYNGAATVPPQFSGVDRRCGMILVWTKDY